MLFADIPGLDEVKATLVRAVHTDHVAHAQLFLSPPGGGGLALALAYATFVNCEGRADTDAEACGTCASCYKMGKLIHPDLHFVFPTAVTKRVPKREDAVSTAFMPEWREFLKTGLYASLADWAAAVGAENKQCIIPVAEGRNIIKTLALKAFEGQYKIMLIWLPELMNVSAANAILKILEEPPEKTLFLLVSQAIDLMLPTILSRTQLVTVRPFHDHEVAAHLRARYPQVAPEQAQQTAWLADGNLAEAQRRVALEADATPDHFRDWMRLCFKLDLAGLVREADKFNALDKEAQKGLLQYALAALSHSLVCQHAGEAALRLEPERLAFIRNFAKTLNPRNLAPLAQLLTDCLHHLERNASPRIIFLDTSLQISQLFKLK
ncbi:MAG: DNA polymerase III subunit delta [Bernardetiaceae bacterium]|jgi:DNA polymerase-3 subunit delta'|nr:DNA polymerase III subunit delta [Bernardetiaceae bacterium]